MRSLTGFKGLFAAALFGLVGLAALARAMEPDTKAVPQQAQKTPAIASDMSIPEARPIPDFVGKSLEWLVAAQHESGGWGAGTHANQQLRDPHKVQVDPATTAFAASALLRAGNTPTDGQYKDSVRKATEYLCGIVEEYNKPGPRITDLQGTQIQSKLGPLVDTVMTSQYFARLLPKLSPDDRLHARVDKALDKCLKKLEEGQQKDGSWNVAGGWAPVLQSSLGGTALELAEAAGKKIDADRLDRARGYLKGNFDRKTGQIASDKAAGVALYAYAGAQRANAAEARAAEELLAKGKAEGKVAKDATVSEETLKQAGAAGPGAAKMAEASAAVAAQNKQLNDERLLAGFGNNGGEEFLSFLLTSESLVIGGGEKWNEWDNKMRERLAKIQNNDGTWSGHHCITSPVFCTAAVVQCLTTDRDAKMLVELARKATDAKTDLASRTASKSK